MEQVNTREDRIINITSSSDVSSSNSLTREEPSINANRSTLSTSARSSSHARRGNTRTRRRSPLNSGLWISIELVLTVSQIVAAIIVLSLSRHEHPRTPLFAWIVGYASGCLAIVPLLYWRYRHRNQNSDRDSRQDGNISLPSSVSNGNINLANDTVSRGVNARFKVLVDYFKTALDCFFAIWFVVGNVWIFGGHSSSSDAPNLYRLCIVFLTFSCIGYAMPFILCTTICCCLPCIISVLGFREDPTQSKGATSESIETLPTYKFKVKKNKGSSNGASEGGIVAAGTEKERVISGEDAVCCICLAKYINNDELKELPCIHYFHKECVDKWLKINATCPLCKSEVGETILSSLTEATASLRQF